MSDRTNVIACRCTTVFGGSRDREQYGDMIVLVKPDGTVLVHDADGYQPVAWLTRASSVTVTEDRVTATDGGETLEVTVHETYARSQQPTSEAGVRVGGCPCGGSLVRAGDVTCPDCGDRYGLPANATVLGDTCGDCGLPLFRVDRGETFEVCLDRACDSLDARVRAAFDREWSCPACGDDLRVLRRGGLILGCASYPDCETGYAFPAGVHSGTCGCGLPTFDTPTGQRCLDARCER
ncbi:MAG: DUF91 domain-containing protein [Halovenus sp.]